MIARPGAAGKSGTACRRAAVPGAPSLAAHLCNSRSALPPLLPASRIRGLRFGDGGLCVLTGEAGIGKTMLLHVLESELRDAGEPVLLHNSSEAGVLDLQQLHDILGDGTILLIDGMEHWDSGAT